MTARINPFNPNSIVTPTLFAGRYEQVLQILKKLTQVREGMPASFVLQGDRGIGKTALAKLIMYAAEVKEPAFQDLKFLTSYYSIEKGQTFDSVLQASLNQMTDRMPENVIQRLTQRLGTFFKNGKFTVGAFGTSVAYDGGGMSEADQPAMVIKDRAVSALSNIVSGLDEVSDPEHKVDGVLIVIDEIHNLKDIDGAAQILRAISTTLDVNRLGKISFVVIGYPEGMERFFTGDPSARRHFDMIELTSMPRKEAKEVLTKGFEKIGLRYDEQALERNIDVAGGYPHSIQIIGHHLVEVDRDGTITDEDWTNALHKSAEELTRKDFSEMYDFVGKGTLRETVLNIVALVGKPISKQELRDFADGKNIYTATCLGELKKSGALKELPDGTLFPHSMLFRAAILIHLYTHMKTNASYRELIERHGPSESSAALPTHNVTR
jgi:hypothetical protein